MNGADTLGMSLYDYQAAVFHWSKAHGDDEDAAPPPTADEVETMFARMEQLGVGKVH